MIDKFFNISDLSSDLFLDIVYGNILKNNNLLNKNIGCIYEHPSTRTRLSFEVAIKNLGGNVINLRYDEMNISKKETFKDTFLAISCYLDALVYRTKSHQSLIDAYKYFDKPVINALSEISHPCQTLADIITIYENFKDLSITISWIGDTNNVTFSLIEAMKFLPMTKLNIFSPTNLSEEKINLDNIKIYKELDEYEISKSQCIMTDVFISMNDKPNNSKEIELQKFQVNDSIMNLTEDNCIFMHCLPANIDSEVTESVLYGNKSVIWEQAKNRQVAQERLLNIINI